MVLGAKTRAERTDGGPGGGREGGERSRIKGYMQVTMGGHMVISEGLMGITQAV